MGAPCCRRVPYRRLRDGLCGLRAAAPMGVFPFGYLERQTGDRGIRSLHGETAGELKGPD